jgi:general nucleoside transport system permease protein
VTGQPAALPPRQRFEDRLKSLTLPRGVTAWSIVRVLGALAATIAIFAILLQLLGSDFVTALNAVTDSAFGNKFNLGQTLMMASILIATGLAAAIPFRAQLWNVGGEGQMWFGAFVTIGIALNLPKGMAPGVADAILVVAAMVAGAVWGLVPGILKATINANEVITSLMMTFIAIELGNWAIDGIWPQGASNETMSVPANTLMPNIWTGTLVTWGLPLAVIAAIVAWALMNRTSLGFEIRAVGLNPRTAQMNGMSVSKVAIVTFAVGGAFAGLAGSIFILGVNGALPSGFPLNNFGYLGIAVALVARLSPLWILPSALLFAALRVGSDGLQASTGLSTTVGQILVALFVILLLAFRLIRFSYPEAASR